MNRIARAAAAALFTIAVAVGGASAAPSASAGQCPGATTIGNTPTDDGTTILPAGLIVCIHAGNGNTGQLETDGVSTLADYILVSGLLNRGGQVPGVSNYVIYNETPTPGPSETPEPSQTPAPTATPATTQSPEVAATPAPELTMPPTDTASSPPMKGALDTLLILLGSVAAAAGMGILLMRRGDR
jgi:hypothetical protein